MNEPIISPWLIYLINLLEPLFFVSLAAACVCMTMIIVYAERRGSSYDEDEQQVCKKEIKKWIKLLFISTVLVVLIPKPETAWQMLVASKVTPATIQATGKVAEDVTRKALELITDSVIKIMQEAKK